MSGHIPSTSSQALTILERFSTHIKGFVEAVQSASNGLDPISHSSRFFLNKTRRNTLILGSEGAGRGVPLPPGSPSRGGAQSTARGALPARWSRQAVAGPPTPQQALSGGGRSHFFPTARVNRALGQERLREPPLPLPRGDNTGLAPHLATSSPAHCAVPCRAPAAPGRLVSAASPQPAPRQGPRPTCPQGAARDVMETPPARLAGGNNASWACRGWGGSDQALPIGRRGCQSSAAVPPPAPLVDVPQKAKRREVLLRAPAPGPAQVERAALYGCGCRCCLTPSSRLRGAAAWLWRRLPVGGSSAGEELRWGAAWQGVSPGWAGGSRASPRWGASSARE